MGGHPTQVTAGKNEEGRSEGGGATSGARSSGNKMTEEGLLEKAFAAGDAGTKYPEGVGALVVEGGGELAGYGSSEILVTFAPLNVGEFRVVKVCLHVFVVRWVTVYQVVENDGFIRDPHTWYLLVRPFPSLRMRRGR